MVLNYQKDLQKEVTSGSKLRVSSHPCRVSKTTKIDSTVHVESGTKKLSQISCHSGVKSIRRLINFSIATLNVSKKQWN